MNPSQQPLRLRTVEEPLVPAQVLPLLDRHVLPVPLTQLHRRHVARRVRRRDEDPLVPAPPPVLSRHGKQERLRARVVQDVPPQVVLAPLRVVARRGFPGRDRPAQAQARDAHRRVPADDRVCLELADAVRGFNSTYRQLEIGDVEICRARTSLTSRTARPRGWGGPRRGENTRSLCGQSRRGGSRSRRRLVRRD